MDRPSQDAVRQRALAIVEECMAYPETARDRLIDIKRGAIESLVMEATKNASILEKYYPGYTVEDLKTLLGCLPKSKGGTWHL